MPYPRNPRILEDLTAKELVDRGCQVENLNDLIYNIHGHDLKIITPTGRTVFAHVKGGASPMFVNLASGFRRDVGTIQSRLRYMNEPGCVVFWDFYDNPNIIPYQVALDLLISYYEWNDLNNYQRRRPQAIAYPCQLPVGKLQKVFNWTLGEYKDQWQHLVSGE